MTTKQSQSVHPLQTLKDQLTLQYKKDIEAAVRLHKLTLAALTDNYELQTQAIDSLAGVQLPTRINLPDTARMAMLRKQEPQKAAEREGNGHLLTPKTLKTERPSQEPRRYPPGSYQPGYGPDSPHGPHKISDDPLGEPLQEVPSGSIPEELPENVELAKPSDLPPEKQQELESWKRQQSLKTQRAAARRDLEEMARQGDDMSDLVSQQPPEDYEPSPEILAEQEQEELEEELGPEDPPSYDETMALDQEYQEEQEAIGEDPAVPDDYDEPTLDEIIDHPEIPTTIEDGPMRGSEVLPKRSKSPTRQAPRRARLASDAGHPRLTHNPGSSQSPRLTVPDEVDEYDEPDPNVHQDDPTKQEITRRLEAQIKRKSQSTLTALIRQTPETGPLMRAAQLYNSCFTVREIAKVLQENGSDITYDRAALACDRLAKAGLLDKAKVRAADTVLTYYQDSSCQTDLQRAAKAKAQAAALRRRPKKRRR